MARAERAGVFVMPVTGGASAGLAGFAAERGGAKRRSSITGRSSQLERRRLGALEEEPCGKRLEATSLSGGWSHLWKECSHAQPDEEGLYAR